VKRGQKVAKWPKFGPKKANIPTLDMICPDIDCFNYAHAKEYARPLTTKFHKPTALSYAFKLTTKFHKPTALSYAFNYKIS
jgi:hypothetical protein